MIAQLTLTCYRLADWWLHMKRMQPKPDVLILVPDHTAHIELQTDERHEKVARMYEPKNWSREMAPKNYTGILLEYMVSNRLNKSELGKYDLLSRKYCERYFNFGKPLHISTYFVENAYPLYTPKSLKLARVFLNKILEKIKNISIIGRQGLFFYNNQDHSIECGRICVKEILFGKKQDYLSLETSFTI